MRKLSKFLLMLPMLSGLVLHGPTAAKARGSGGSYGGGGTMIFIPPSGGSLGGAYDPGRSYGTGGDQIGNRSGGHHIGGDSNNSYIRQRDGSGNYTGNGSRSKSYMRHRANDVSIARSKRSQTREFSRHSDFEASRKHRIPGVKKRHGHYRGESRDVHHDFARQKHKHHHRRYGKYRYYYDGWWYSEPWWTYSPSYYDDGLTCLEVQQMIRQQYRSVRVVECVGRIYAFRAKNVKGKVVELKVNSLTGTYWLS
jgi:hypothetical protein